MAFYPEILVGTYEEFLLGYDIKKNDNGEFQLSMTVASHAHQGSIRCVAAYKHLLASSGADEYVNVFSLISKKEVAILTPHAGTVTCLSFVPDGSHLISASQDGSISIVRCSDWRTMKLWKEAHKRANGVLGLSVHSSGKLLLSIGADNTLRVWNLVKGRQAYAVNFNKKTSPGNTLNLVTWSEDGSHYAVCIGQIVEVYSTESAALVYTIKSASRVSCVEFWSEVMALGRDDGKVELHNVVKKKKTNEVEAHNKRVKCARLFRHKKESFLITADSQGRIKLWQIVGKQLELKAEVNADCRIVCLTIVNPNDFVKKEGNDANEITLAKTPSKGKDESEANKKVEATIENNSSKLDHSGNLRKKKKKSQESAKEDEMIQSSSELNYLEQSKQKSNCESPRIGKKRSNSFVVSDQVTKKTKSSDRFSTSKWQVE